MVKELPLYDENNSKELEKIMSGFGKGHIRIKKMSPLINNATFIAK